MKHLFLIHSHTVFLTAMGVIEKLGLRESEVVIMNFRNYRNPKYPIAFECYDFTKTVEDSFHIFFSYSRKHFLLDKKMREKVVGEFDGFIDNVIHEEYALYVPQLQSPTFQILATNDKCKEVLFVQEGGRVMFDCITDKNKWYFTLYNILFMRNEKRMWKAYNWFPDKYAHYKRPIKAFAFDKAYFGKMPTETIMVTWPIMEIDIKLNMNYPVFVMEAAVELGQVEKQVYMKALGNLIDNCAKENNYIKFHPQQSKDTQEQIVEIFHQKGKDVESLPMNVPFELVLSSNKNMTVCGFGSSLLFYAKAFGHKVVSYEQDLMVSPRYRLYCKNIQKLN